MTERQKVVTTARIRCGMRTDALLAERIGISNQLLAYWINCSMSVDHLKLVADTLKMTDEEIARFVRGR